MWEFPGSTGAIVRKTYASMGGSVLNTFKRLLGPESSVKPFGGEKPEWFDYPNGSRVYVGGMDNPLKVLSSERDFIYINQTEELDLGDWETLTTRCTGRGAVSAPYAQMFGDCNPGPPSHWIRTRPSVQFLESRHEDNPTLFDPEGNILPQGIKSMKVLDALTGVRKQRLRYGKWVQVEGAVYEEWDRARNLLNYNTPEFPYAVIPDEWARYRALDFGHTNPFVCQWWAVDFDGRAYLYREIYKTKRTNEEHADHINRLSQGEVYQATVSDHDAGVRATLQVRGIPTELAYKELKPGIDAVALRIRGTAEPEGDGKPRLYVMEGALVERDDLIPDDQPHCTEQEFERYMWLKGADGKPVKEVPLDLYNHGMDAMRYVVCRINALGCLFDGKVAVG